MTAVVASTGGYKFTGNEPSIVASVDGKGLINLKFTAPMQFNSTSADLLNNDT